jgi:hypothetical protein
VLAFSFALVFLLWWRCRLLAAASVESKTLHLLEQALAAITWSTSPLSYIYSYFIHV